MKKAFRALAIVAALALIPVAPAFADAWSPKPPGSQAPGEMQFDISEANQWNRESRIVSLKSNPSGMPDEHNCPVIGEEFCDFSGSIYRQSDATLFAPLCQSATQRNCIEGLSIFKDGQAKTAATFIRHIGGPRIEPQETYGVTEGSTISLWSAPGLTHAGGTDTYAVFPAFNIIYNKNLNKFEVRGVTVSVVPYVDRAGSYSDVTLYGGVLPDGRTYSSVSNSLRGCAWNDAGHCGVAQDFAEGTKAQVTIRVDKTVKGWFSGRLLAPSIGIKSLNATTNVISIDASFVEVPRASMTIRKETASLKATELINKRFAGLPNWGTGGSVATLVYYESAFEQLDAFREDAKDTAAGVSTIWSLQSSPNGSGSQCLSSNDQVLGIVTTNSMVYEQGAPGFSEGFLNYRVAGMHYLPDGKTEAQGSYDLVMRSDVARCLYGLSKAPISATIAVAGGTDKTVSTTIVSEKNGWLKLAAYGFTFSNKTIKVKISQPKVVKKTTITCVKGKTTKKVTASAPKCPTGYKKK